MAHPQRERCVQCSKIAFELERLTIDGQIYHKSCLRCKTCSMTLAIHNYVNVRGAIYCKRHVPHETLAPKIAVNGDLSISPRPLTTTTASDHALGPRLSPRVHYTPVSPRNYGQPITTGSRTAAPPLSPRAHNDAASTPAPSAAPAANPPTTATATESTSPPPPPPALLVHTSSDHKVVIPDAFKESSSPSVSHSASSEEDDAQAPNKSDGLNKADRPPRSDRPRKTSGGRKEKSDRKTDHKTDNRPENKNLGPGSAARQKKERSSRSSNDRERTSSDAPLPATATSVAAAAPSAQSSSAAESAVKIDSPVAPISIPPPAEKQPLPPLVPSPRSPVHTASTPTTMSNGPAAVAPHPPVAPAAASHHLAAPPVYHPPPAHQPTSKDKEKKRSGEKHEHVVQISGPLTREELARFRGEQLPIPPPASQPGSSPRHHETVSEPKVAAEKAALLAFAKLPENSRCADCGASPAEWASANLGIFVCIACSGSHRALGTHITKVKSVLLDDWTQAEIDHFVTRGNAKAASVQHPVQLPPDVAMDRDTPQPQRNAVIRARYTGQPYVVPHQESGPAARKDTTKVVMAAGVLKIHVIEGRNLPSKDLNGYSDPYVVIVQQGQRVGKTNKIKKTLNPKWNETVMVNLPSLAEKLLLQVYDWDRIGSHSFMGEAPLNLLLYNITPNNGVRFWLPVFAKEKQQGEVQLELTYFPIG